jgi:hypothetical protein
LASLRSVWEHGELPSCPLKGLNRMESIVKDLVGMMDLHWDPMFGGTEWGESGGIFDFRHNALVIMEDFALGGVKRQSYVREIAGVTYLLRHRLWNLGIDCLLVSPTQLKKFITGFGGTRKKGQGEEAVDKTKNKGTVIKEVFIRFKINVDDDNEADAIGLAHIGAALLGKWEPVIQPQREVLAELRERFPMVRGKR